MKFYKRTLIAVLVLFIGLYIWGKIYSIEPALVTRPILADTTRIKNDLYFLTKECRFRNFMHPGQLNKSADYIKQQFVEVSGNVEFQKYRVKGEEFKNVICSLGPRDAERILSALIMMPVVTKKVPMIMPAAFVGCWNWQGY